MSLVYEGKVAWIFPDNFDVDLIVGVQHIKETNPEKFLPLTMKEYEPNFLEQVAKGDILVAGKNFGYGHPHFQGMAAMRKLGLWCILAESFAPAFFRSEIVSGMALLTVPGITERVNRFDRVRVEVEQGLVHNLNSGDVIKGVKPSSIILDLINNRGMIGFIKAELARDLGKGEGD